MSFNILLNSKCLAAENYDKLEEFQGVQNVMEYKQELLKIQKVIHILAIFAITIRATLNIENKRFCS